MIETVNVKAILECVEAPGFGVRVVEYPKGMWQPFHTHDHASVTLVLSGAIEEEQTDRTELALPFSIIVKAPGIPHSDRFGPKGSKTLQINFPRDFDLRECNIETQRVIWHNDGGISLGPLLRLLKCIDEASVLVESHVVFRLYEALEALPTNSPLNFGGTPVWLDRIKDLIDDSDPTRPMAMSQLQADAKIHPVHITRQFKRRFGCTVREYMQYRRVRAAATFVADSSLSLTEVAHKCGFADQAHFCRAFRAVAKLTARDYRRLSKTVGMLKVENVQVVSPSNNPYWV